jgi:hypothetical protein
MKGKIYKIHSFLYIIAQRKKFHTIYPALQGRVVESTLFLCAHQDRESKTALHWDSFRERIDIVGKGRPPSHS